MLMITSWKLEFCYQVQLTSQRQILSGVPQSSSISVQNLCFHCFFSWSLLRREVLWFNIQTFFFPSPFLWLAFSSAFIKFPKACIAQEGGWGKSTCSSNGKAHSPKDPLASGCEWISMRASFCLSGLVPDLQQNKEFSPQNSNWCCWSKKGGEKGIRWLELPVLLGASTCFMSCPVQF